ncbi:protein containing Por secretion system C-terminal sorting domain [Lentimicrobium saccharophilum]|uniref:Protein containing Por secretion system C-terminal sorting domain n=1 Tax=Lentimicrobium saccharophilum TaxID=1678841 RepID=A0A0S7C5A2_9BACT|nr:C10 family peptidase [Lentimicrobium saccharophilum]GAP43999.1 protein containing Por secretion system C-terminal sorting domain [Lentimicrobium saccharophilum]
MKKYIFFIQGLMLSVLSLAKPVTMEDARVVADIYFSHFSGRVDPVLLDFTGLTYDNILVYYVFNYSGGGFVVVAADDAVIPIMAQANAGYLEKSSPCPSVKFWFESISKEVFRIVSMGADNSATIKRWDRIRNHEFSYLTRDVGPLLSTTWDQGVWYNFYCPADLAGPGGHTWAGCVATSTGQIMKYHSFPVQGVLAHSYVLPVYGTQSVNFGETTYHWEAMDVTANQSSYQDIATLLYHAGVAVEMSYSPYGSGASENEIPWALSTYFNYDPSTVRLEYKADYSDAEWEEMMKADLNASLPLFYGGDDGTSGHGWVCDGWRPDDNMFHMNWGWSGNSDGWYAIGALNTFNGNYNNNNFIIRGIRPGNAELIVRITNLVHGEIIGYGPIVNINCSLIAGTANTMNLFMDDSLIYTTGQADFTFELATLDYDLGLHIIKLEAINASDTVFHAVEVGNIGWEEQASAFTNEGRGIKYICAVDSLVAWAIAYDGVYMNNYIQEFTRTVNGGETWTPGVISNCSGLEPAMIFALNSDTAYCPMFRQTGSNPQGIYVTWDNGSSWTRQTSASFSDAASFPNVVHFFNKYDGFCMGDPVNGEFEIYTTTDGGNTWTPLPGDVIPDPFVNEYGVTGYYSGVGNSVWFGTSKGRVFRSSDKGLHWDVSTTTFAGRYVDVRFADGLHGLAQDKNLNNTGALCETFDGGVTWSPVTINGQIGTNDFCFVPGTDNTWLSNEAGSNPGSFFSMDGGHSWERISGTEGRQFLALDFINNRTGWAGGFNLSSTEGGVYSFIGSLLAGSVLAPVTGLYAIVTGTNVDLNWTAPAYGQVSGYYVYRNDTLLTAVPVTYPVYNDFPVPIGMHTYCVTAAYSSGESEAACTQAEITYGFEEENDLIIKFYPNPVREIFIIESPVYFRCARLFNLSGQQVFECESHRKILRIPTGNFQPGIYIIQVVLNDKIITAKILIE